MSMLSTFAILFETDSKKAAKETDELADALDDVEKSAGETTKVVDAFSVVGKKASDTATKAAKDLAKMAAAYLTVKAVVDGVMGNALGIDVVGKLSQTIGLNVVELDAWGIAAERNGGSVEALRGTVESLQTSLQDIEITGGGEIINTLAMIGIQATKSNGEIKSAFEILPEIAKAFEGMSTEKSFAFGKRLGLDQGTILTLQQSRHEIDKLIERQKMLGGVTKDGYENAAKFNDQWSDTKRVFNSLWLSANNSILPLLQGILKGLESAVVWVKNNQTLVEGFFIGVAGVITAVYLPAITAAAAATLLAISPFVLIGTAIVAAGVAISVLYEDTLAWVDGSKSAIGELLGSFKGFKNEIKGIFDGIGEMWDETKGRVNADVEYISNIFGFSGDDQATAAAQSTLSSYSNTNLNHGGSVSNQRTQQNNITVGGAKIDARGMSANQAKNAFNTGMSESIEMAMGQLADGVER